MTTLSAASLEYLDFMRARGLARSTVRTAQNMMTHARAAWGDIELSELQPRHVDAYFIGKQWSIGTRNINLLALRSFLRWCRTHRYLPPDYDPTEGWTSRPLEKRERTWLTLPVLDALIESTDHARDRVFIAIGIFTFLRASEIVNLRVSDLDIDAHELRVYRIKTKQQDRLPICLELEQELARWLQYYHAECGTLDPDWFLVPSCGPQPMRGVPGERRLVPTGAPRRLKPGRMIGRPQRIVKQSLERLGIDKHGDGCHVLRRSGARALYEQLRDMGHDGAARRVQSMLGHASLIMTEKYLGIDHERRQRNEALAGQPMFAARPALPSARLGIGASMTDEGGE
jgi:integrase